MAKNPAVPDTTTFSLQDVVDSVAPTTDDLNDCFNDAVSGQFDPAYEGNKDNLLNFRNYGNQTSTGVTDVNPYPSGGNYDSGRYAYLPPAGLGYYAAQVKSTDGSGTGMTANIELTTILNGNPNPTYFWSGNYQITNAGSGYAVGDSIVWHISGYPSQHIIYDASTTVTGIG